MSKVSLPLPYCPCQMVQKDNMKPIVPNLHLAHLQNLGQSEIQNRPFDTPYSGSRFCGEHRSALLIRAKGAPEYLVTQ